jgi:integrase/recombinase XerD
MYACGLRISEAATSEIASIDSASLLLRIIGKGDKERRVPLPQPMLYNLRRIWLTHRNPRWLCPDRLGTRPVSKNALWRTFRLSVRAAGSNGRSARMRCGIVMRRDFWKAVSIRAS